MRYLGKSLLAAAAVVVAVVLFLVLRPEADPRSQPAETLTQRAETQAIMPATAPATTQEATAPAPLRVRLAVRGGEVTGPERVEIERGRRLVLLVRSDVVDHVHVHGYDVFADVSPGSPARITLRARVPGRFEVELEDRHQLLTTLVVAP